MLKYGLGCLSTARDDKGCLSTVKDEERCLSTLEDASVRLRMLKYG